MCEKGNLTVNSSRYSNGTTPIECITGDTPDVSEYIDFGFYDWVMYQQNARLDKPEIGRWLGISHKVGKLIKSHASAPHRPNENPAEGNIREIKKKWYRIQAKTNAPDIVWEY